MDISNGQFMVRGVEIIDVAEALSAANVARTEAGQRAEPRELSDFEGMSLRVAAASDRERNKWNQRVYDTDSLAEGLPLVEAQTQAQLAVDGLSKAARLELEAKLARLTRMREGLASLATANS